METTDLTIPKDHPDFKKLTDIFGPARGFTYVGPDKSMDGFYFRYCTNPDGIWTKSAEQKVRNLLNSIKSDFEFEVFKFSNLEFEYDRERMFKASFSLLCRPKL